MKPQKTSALRIGIALCAAAGVAHAQFSTGPGETGEAEKTRRYTVEMIIFEYAEDVGLGSEIFVPEPVEPAIEGIDDAPAAMLQDDTDPASSEDEPLEIDLGIQTLPRDALTMNETLARLERLDAYRPLMHFGWSQATVAEELSPELPLARFGTPPPGLDGNLKLYLNRFLHLVVDVSRLAPDGAAAMRTTRPAIATPGGRFNSSPERSTFGREMVVEYEPLRYRISEDRIMKNGETRYYDHPKIGVIAKVTRVEEDDEAASAGF